MDRKNVVSSVFFRTAPVLIALASAGRSAVAEPPATAPAPGGEIAFSIVLDRGEDIGQNFGTLFEVRSTEGRPLVGAGFLGAYNTFDRADRHVLHVFERSGAPATFEALPRCNGDAGVYLFSRGRRLYARSAADGKDGAIRVFDDAKKGWAVAEGVGPDATAVADGLLEVGERAVRYKDQTLLQWPEGRGRLGRPYYAQGLLVLWNHFDRDDARLERFLAWEWRPGKGDRLSPSGALTLQLGKKGEFPYAMGQLGGDILATTNLGGVYRLRSGRWETLRSPDGKSHQVYCALNVGEALWLGHYPSGEVIGYDGDSLRPKPGHPPVMPGVSGAAREAQSLTLFGGDVYAGVWPWAELWRLGPGAEGWGLARRMFSRPAPSNVATHPYERETVARGGPVLNQWGQRVTSLVPLGSDLFVSTSAKSSKPWSPEFDFLDEAAREEYGRVYRMSRPGHVAAPLRWTDGPTRLRVVLGPGTIVVLQDGKVVGEARRASPVDRPPDDSLRKAPLIRGRGLYGAARAKSLSVDAERPAAE